MKLEKLQQIRIKFLRLILRLGLTTQESIAAEVLHRLNLIAGRYQSHTSQIFNLNAAEESAFNLEARGEILNYSLNVLVLGKSGVGKSATINSIFGKVKTKISAYGSATNSIKEIVGMVDGVSIRVFDTPGLKSSALEQCYNKKVLSMIQKLTKKKPIDIVLYVDRLDIQTKNLNDLPLLRTICNVFGPLIWRNTVITLTHAATAPPDGPLGSPLSYDVFVTQRTRAVQQAIGQVIGDERIMNPSLMNPVALVESHASCRKNKNGHKVLPNGQTWRPLLLLLCYSMKILSEATSLSKTKETFDYNKLFGFRVRTPSLPYLLSWLMQPRNHPKLASNQGGNDIGSSENEFAELSDSDQEDDEDEYDRLLPFRPLKKSQVAKLSREQRKAYFEEYDYRAKLLQKKQWKEELRRMREIKKNKGKSNANDDGYTEEGAQNMESPDAVQTPVPDMIMPLSFDGDNPVFRYRFLESTSQFLTRPVLDVNGWDHDYGYDGVTIENSLAIVNKFPASFGVQVAKDKKDFNMQLESSVAAKHGENGSSMAGFDIQNIGKQLAYVVRGETKFKNFKRNKTCAGVSAMFLGENVCTGLKVEDQIALGKCLLLMGSAGLMRSQGDSAYGTNVEVRFKEADFPIGQDQSSLSLSLVKWRGELALGANLQSQFSIGRSYKMAVRAGLNNKRSGQISVRTSSSEQLQIALVAVLPIVRAIYANFWSKTYAPTTLAAARDFWTLRYTTSLEDGSLVICERSLNASTGGPTGPSPSNFVRAEMLPSGFLIRPCEGGGSIIHIVDHVDLDVWSVPEVLRPLYESSKILAQKLTIAALQHIKQIAQESSGEIQYGGGRQPAVLRTFSQRLCRGFNDAVNGFVDDGWSLLGNDGVEDVTIAVNSSPNKFLGSNYSSMFPTFGGGVLCAKASMLLQNVPPALLVRFLREHRSEWADYGVDAYSATCLKSSPYAVPCPRPGGFPSSQVILPLAPTIEHEEFLEVVRIEGHAFSPEDVALARDMYLLQLCSGIDENSIGACAQLVFAPIDESFADDALLLPSGFRVIPLDPKSDGPTTSRTLDLLEGSSNARPSGEGAGSNGYNLRSVLTIAFQFTFENHLRDNVASMARQYVRSVVASVQRVAMAIAPSRPGTQLGPKSLPGSPEAHALARWISRSYRMHTGAELFRVESAASDAILKQLWHHSDAIMCCSVKTNASPIFTFSNQAGLDMLETTLVALQDIMLDKVLDEAGRKILCSEFSKIMQQGYASLPGGICVSSMNRPVSYEQAIAWKVLNDDDANHCLAFMFINWSFV